MIKYPKWLSWVAGMAALLVMVGTVVSPVYAQNSSGQDPSSVTCSTPTAPNGYGYYVVQTGDTLSTISSKFGVPADTIQALNPGVGYTKGEIILLPSVPAPGMWDNQLLCGRTANVPSLGQASITSPIVPVTGKGPDTTVLTPIQSCVSPNAPKGYGYYVIQKGDTLQSIADRLNTSISTIESLNPGAAYVTHQVILVPAGEAPGFWDNQLLCP